MTKRALSAQAFSRWMAFPAFWLPRNVFPSTAIVCGTPVACASHWVTPLRKASNACGSINCNTRLNVSWLGIPGNAIHFSIHSRLALVTSSISVNVVAPESIATTVQKRICGSSYTRVRATRGSLTANIKRNKT